MKASEFIPYQKLTGPQKRHIQFCQLVGTSVEKTRESFIAAFGKRVSGDTVKKVKTDDTPKFEGTDAEQALQCLGWMKHDHVILQQDKKNGPLISKTGERTGLFELTSPELEKARCDHGFFS